MDYNKDTKFAVIAEADNTNHKMIMLNLPFGRLLDEIVHPYDTEEAFFIDGVPLTKEKIKRIKIVVLTDEYSREMSQLQRNLKLGPESSRKMYGEQFNSRFENIIMTTTIDVTSQIIKAYNEVVKPSIKDYLPKRGELIEGTTKVFLEAIKQLG